MDAWLLSLGDSPWVYLAMFASAVVDGFFPPMPSEVAAVGLSALAVAGGSPNLALLLVVAAVGAFVGDLVAYWIGSRVDPHRLPLLRSGRGARMLAWAERSLASRGRSFILAGRFLPVARVAISMAAGALGYPRRSFAALAAIGGGTWAVYSAVIGAGAGAWFVGHPLGAVLVGVVVGLVLGVVIDAVLTRAQARRAGTGGSAAVRG